MKKRIFNSKYEIIPRIILLTSFDSKMKFSLDKIIAYDFMTVYGHEFIDEGENLQGENGFKYSELSARKQIFHEVIKEMVRKHLLNVEVANGFIYSATEESVRIFHCMESSYAITYKKQIKNVLNLYSNFSELELYNFIQSKSLIE